MSLPTPQFLTQEACVVSTTKGDKNLPAESFVREISEYYLPKHIKEEEEKKPAWDKFKPDTQIYVYCHYGIVPIPKRILRRAGG